jgi:hypothetical protein
MTLGWFTDAERIVLLHFSCKMMSSTAYDIDSDIYLKCKTFGTVCISEFLNFWVSAYYICWLTSEPIRSRGSVRWRSTFLNRWMDFIQTRFSGTSWKYPQPYFSFSRFDLFYAKYRSFRFDLLFKLSKFKMSPLFDILHVSLLFDVEHANPVWIGI